MSIPHTSALCNRSPRAHEQLLRDTVFDDQERACLDVARLFFSSFAAPNHHNWVRAFEFAEHVFDHEKGPGMAMSILKVIQAIRTSRTSVFIFSNPDCPGCARILTEHERRLVIAVACARRERFENAQLELMMLCEGNDTSPIMTWLAELSAALPAPCRARDVQIRKSLEQRRCTN